MPVYEYLTKRVSSQEKYAGGLEGGRKKPPYKRQIYSKMNKIERQYEVHPPLQKRAGRTSRTKGRTVIDSVTVRQKVETIRASDVAVREHSSMRHTKMKNLLTTC
jgi:hypothetical protein